LPNQTRLQYADSTLSWAQAAPTLCHTHAALVEALIGLQFNDVGGGTKTRRPLALHMRYNPTCHIPLCILVNDDMSEQEMTLPELQVRGRRREGGVLHRTSIT
jgi:hypothetical protein